MTNETTKPKTLPQHNLDPKQLLLHGNKHGDISNQDKTKHDVVGVQISLDNSSVPVNQDTVMLSYMLQEGSASTSGLTKQEEVITTRINQLNDSLDQVEDCARGEEGLLANVLEIPIEQLQQRQDGGKMI